MSSPTDEDPHREPAPLTGGQLRRLLNTHAAAVEHLPVIIGGPDFDRRGTTTGRADHAWIDDGQDTDGPHLCSAALRIGLITNPHQP